MNEGCAGGDKKTKTWWVQLSSSLRRSLMAGRSASGVCAAWSERQQRRAATDGRGQQVNGSLDGRAGSVGVGRSTWSKGGSRGGGQCLLLWLVKKKKVMSQISSAMG